MVNTNALVEVGFLLRSGHYDPMTAHMGALHMLGGQIPIAQKEKPNSLSIQEISMNKLSTIVQDWSLKRSHPYIVKTVLSLWVGFTVSSDIRQKNQLPTFATHSNGLVSHYCQNHQPCIFELLIFFTNLKKKWVLCCF